MWQQRSRDPRRRLVAAAGLANSSGAGQNAHGSHSRGSGYDFIGHWYLAAPDCATHGRASLTHVSATTHINAAWICAMSQRGSGYERKALDLAPRRERTRDSAHFKADVQLILAPANAIKKLAVGSAFNRGHEQLRANQISSK